MQAEIERVLDSKDYPLSAKFIATQLNVGKQEVNRALAMMVSLGTIERLDMMPPIYRRV